MSEIMARLGSRAIEKVAPIASRLKPSMSAKGIPRSTVPRLPNSCNMSAGPDLIIRGKVGPMFVPYLAINSRTDTVIKLSAVFISSMSVILRNFGPVRSPSKRAYNMGSSTTVPGPTLKLFVPMNSANTTRTRTIRCSFSCRFSSDIFLSPFVMFY